MYLPFDMSAFKKYLTNPNWLKKISLFLILPLLNTKENLKNKKKLRQNRYFPKNLILYFALISLIAPIKSFSHDHYSEKEIETALAVFEKAIMLSPDFIEQTQTNAVTPFYKVNGHKIYLNDGFWNLTKAWLRIYIQEVENYCPCDLDPELMIEKAKKHFAQSLPKQKADKAKNFIRNSSPRFTQATAKYGYTFAVAQLTFETAETIFFTLIGLPGAHAFCNIGNIAITFTNRIIQKYIRTFSNGQKLSTSGLIFFLKMIWLSRQVRKSQNKTFFIIKEALAFSKGSLEKVNQKGPKDHRLLWLNKLKQKTDPLFEKLSHLTEQYNNLENQIQEITETAEGTQQINKIQKQQKKIRKQIEKTQNKINQLSKINRKSFFGNRFKRYLLLKTRKKHKDYMTGHHLSDKIIGKKMIWPLAVQENILEQVLDNKNQTHSLKTEPDEIQKALVKEFLSKRQADDIKQLFNKEQQVVYSLLESIEQIFDTKKDLKSRLMITQSIENVLSVLFGKYLQLSLNTLKQKYDLSYKELIRLNWIFGRFSHSIHEFSDFLSSVSIIKNKDKIKFYKYESMEKLLGILDYFYEVQNLLKNEQLAKEVLFTTLQERYDHLMSLSLLKDKRTAFSLMPFKKVQVKCSKIVEKK